MHTNTNVAKAQEVVVTRPLLGYRWLKWLVPRPFYVVSSAFYLCVLAGSLYTFGTALSSSQLCGCQPEWARLLIMICAIFALFALDRLEYRLFGEETPRRAAIILFCARLLIYEVAAATDYYQYSLVLTLFLPLLGYWYFGSLVGCALALLACMDYAIHQAINTPAYLSDQSTTLFNLLFVMALVFTFALVHVLIEEKASRTRGEYLLSELAEAHHQLHLYAQQVEELATTKERNRLARDIHDSLGHYLTAINVQLEKALVFRARDEQEAEQAVRDARQLAREALQEVRRSVSTLRTTEETFTFTAAITDLVAHLQSNQVKLSFQIKGSEETYSKQVLIVLFRAAQEGLTNIQKHAVANEVELAIDFGEENACLDLRDNGQGFETLTLTTLAHGRQGSYGLQGVRERLETVGGSLQITSHPGKGTHMHISIPRTLPSTQQRATAEGNQT